MFDKRATELANVEELKRTLQIAIHNHSASFLSPAGADQSLEKNQQLQYQNLAATVYRYLEAKLKLETPTSHGLHNVLEGLPVLSLRKQSFLMIRYLQNSLVELTSGSKSPNSPVSDTMLMYNNFILCSTLSSETTEKLYYKYVDHMLEAKLMSSQSPAFIPNEKRLSSAFNLKLNFNFDPLGTSTSGSEVESNSALSPDGFVQTQLDLVAREDLVQAFAFQTDDEKEKERRSVFISIQEPGIAVLFLTKGVCSIDSDLRKRISDLFKRSCPKLSETIRMDCEENEEMELRSSNFDVAAVDELSSTSRNPKPFSERPESLKLRVDLAAQLRREFHLGGRQGEVENDSTPDCTTSELMVHSHNSVWASLQKSGLKRYYMISEEDTLIGAHVGMRKNAEKVFETCIP